MATAPEIKLTRSEILDLVIEEFIQTKKAEQDEVRKKADVKKREAAEYFDKIKAKQTRPEQFEGMIEEMEAAISKIAKLYGFTTPKAHIEVSDDGNHFNWNVYVGGMNKKTKRRNKDKRMLEKYQKLQKEAQDLHYKAMNYRCHPSMFGGSEAERRRNVARLIAQQNPEALGKISELSKVLMGATINAD